MASKSRTIAGTIGSNGRIISGRNFKVSHSYEGVYEVRFDRPFDVLAESYIVLKVAEIDDDDDSDELDEALEKLEELGEIVNHDSDEDDYHENYEEEEEHHSHHSHHSHCWKDEAAADFRSVPAGENVWLINSSVMGFKYFTLIVESNDMHLKDLAVSFVALGTDIEDD